MLIPVSWFNEEMFQDKLNIAKPYFSVYFSSNHVTK